MSETFKILGNSITFSEENMIFNSVRYKYSNMALDYTNRYREKYKSYGDIENVCKYSTKFCMDMIQECADDYIKTLIKAKIYTVDIESFLSIYINELVDVWTEGFDKVYDKYLSIIYSAEQMDTYRTARRNSRGKWVGGGFGVSGAIKGAATAGVLNMASGAVHGTINILGKSMNMVSDSFKKMALYDDPKNLEILCETVASVVIRFMYCVCDNSNLPTMPLDSKRAKTLYNNLPNITDPNDREQVISQIFYYNPYMVEIYEQCLEAYGDENKEISRMAETFHIDLTSYYNRILGKYVSYTLPQSLEFLLEKREILLEKMDELGFEVTPQSEKVNNDITMKIYNSLNLSTEEKAIEAKAEYISNIRKFSLYDANNYIGKIDEKLDEFDRIARTCEGVRFYTREGASKARVILSEVKTYMEFFGDRTYEENLRYYNSYYENQNIVYDEKILSVIEPEMRPLKRWLDTYEVRTLVEDQNSEESGIDELSALKREILNMHKDEAVSNKFIKDIDEKILGIIKREHIRDFKWLSEKNYAKANDLISSLSSGFSESEIKKDSVINTLTKFTFECDELKEKYNEYLNSKKKSPKDIFGELLSTYIMCCAIICIISFVILNLWFGLSLWITVVIGIAYFGGSCMVIKEKMEEAQVTKENYELYLKYNNLTLLSSEESDDII